VAPVLGSTIGFGWTNGIARVVQRGDESGSVAAIIAQPVDVDLVISIAGLVVDLELNGAAEIRADARRETLDYCRILTWIDLPNALRCSLLFVLENDGVGV
jgi:hypothetical protein